MTFKMKHLSQKLWLMTALILIIVFGGLFLANNFMINQYYIFKVNQRIDEAYLALQRLSFDELNEEKDMLEETYQVTIVTTNFNRNLEELNVNLEFLLQREQIRLSKFWVTEEVVRALENRPYINKVYTQPKLKSSFVTRMYEQDEQFILIGVPITQYYEVVAIVNQFNGIIIVVALIISLALIRVISNKIIAPLEQLKSQAKQISRANYEVIDVKTGDEIESLAESINDMSLKLKQIHETLDDKNSELKHLISKISHEFKTPLTLIQAYANGIKDGYDDGTYSDVILEQVHESTQMIDRILQLSRLEQSKPYLEPIDLQEALMSLIEKYDYLFKTYGLVITLDIKITHHPIVLMDKNELNMVLDNLLMNAIKYTETQEIIITLSEQPKHIEFSIKNKTTMLTNESIKQLFEPFYVHKQTSSKISSGTGLGLSIIANILNRSHQSYHVNIEDNYFIFIINFEKIER